MTSEYQPDPDAAAEAAWREYLEVGHTASRQLEAMGGVPEIGTDAGERYRALERDRYHAYDRYLDAWSAAHPAEPDREAAPGWVTVEWDSVDAYLQDVYGWPDAATWSPEPEPELEAG